MFIVLSYIFAFLVVYFPVLFCFVCKYISQEIGWEDYSRDIFRVKGFPHTETRCEELFIVMVSFYVMYSNA